ncbi:MAG: tetratricopeptide repeat protein [Thiohalocapsa sp.]|jgi:tetratricopeptide (TPR) repeat protein|uniref:tetratricopeptide repeat protein n=1 Tax=Thiohalocapsa sp. TaxID=2497641 RepID=UPI0025EF89CA|nr:tetratricopeptide repeat protein [Thiohalocapsa sp.]MCG6943149.1 tetratricopeptide repeat protein [Thiohalocapsa sp.]
MTLHVRQTTLALTAAAMVWAAAPAPAAGGMDQQLLDIQHQWARAMYQTPASGQDAAFTRLDAATESLARQYPGRAEPMIWEAISRSSHAKATGGLGALGMAKAARDLLLKAERIDPKALNGSVYTSLGALYGKVPGWPVGFGDKDKAERYLKQALAMNPEGIDPNYLYGDFLFGQGRYAEAEGALDRAMHAPKRPNRPLADQGRRQEIRALLSRVRAKLAAAGYGGVKEG